MVGDVLVPKGVLIHWGHTTREVWREPLVWDCHGESRSHCQRGKARGISRTKRQMRPVGTGASEVSQGNPRESRDI